MPQLTEEQIALMLANELRGLRETLTTLTEEQQHLVQAQREMRETLAEMSARDSWVETYRHEVETPNPVFNELRDEPPMSHARARHYVEPE